MERCAVFSCLGLGDGLIALVLSNNLHLNGKAVETFHPSLSGLQAWFPHLPIRPFPSEQERKSLLASFDKFYIIYEKTPWMQGILEECQRLYPDRTVVLNPIATSRSDYPYWEGGKFDGNRPFVENLYAYCKNHLGFTVVTKSNGIAVPENLCQRQFEKRVIFHPGSSRPGKNWSQEKFLQLAGHLKDRGFLPAMILTPAEREGWDLRGVESPEFTSLSELAAYVCESGYMIGNDSGIGHLASCLGLPTLTVCRSVQASRFWRPAWAHGKVVTPSTWIPNIKGLRLRDQHWKKWISVRRVLRTFSSLFSYKE